MRQVSVLVLFFSFCCSVTSGQTPAYKKLLDTAITPSRSIFVDSKPIAVIRLNKTEMWDYYNNYVEDSKMILDTIMFAQIILHSKETDTTPWKDSELDRLILIKSGGEAIDINYVLTKFNITDNRQIKAYKKIIGNFNSSHTNDRNIYSYSRPVFDNSKQFAIIQWENEHINPSGDGGIILFQFVDDSWEELGSVMTWKD